VTVADELLAASDARTGNGSGNGNGDSALAASQDSDGDSLKYSVISSRAPSVDQLARGVEAAMAGRASAFGNRRLLLSLKSGDQPRRATALLLDSPHMTTEVDALSPTAVGQGHSAGKLLLADGSSTQSQGSAAFVAHNGLSVVAKQTATSFPPTASSSLSFLPATKHSNVEGRPDNTSGHKPPLH